MKIFLGLCCAYAACFAFETFWQRVVICGLILGFSILWDATSALLHNMNLIRKLMKDDYFD